MRSIASERAFRAEGFRVWTYRSIRDSGFVPLSSVTALVGREQSGKTNLLRALAGLDPRARSPYSVHRDWPRGRKPQPSGEQIVCALDLWLHATLKDDLVNDGILQPDAMGLRVGRTYDGQFLVSALNDLALHGDNHPPPHGERENEKLHHRVLKSLPALLYASASSMLPDRVEVADLVKVCAPDWEGDEDHADQIGLRALAQLLGLRAGGEPENEAAALVAHLTSRASRLNRTLHELRLPHHLAITEDHGQLRIMVRSASGTRSLAKLAPARRFQLTLDLRIASAHARSHVAPILLLDAPGKAFKGGLKRQLRPTLFGYSKVGIPVVYSSRLPFHVELQHPEQVLVLGPSALESKPLCARAARGSDLTPMAALGMQGRSSFRIDDTNLVVEGPTDADILAALGQLLASSGEPSIPDGLNIIGAGGAFEVTGVSLFLARQGLGVVALFDSDAAGLAGLGQLNGALKADRSIRGTVRPHALGDAAGIALPGATIEDLFPPAFFVDALRSVADDQGFQLIEDLGAHSPLEDDPHVARQLARAFHTRHLRYPKVEVAMELAKRIASMQSLTELPEEMQPTALALIRALRASLDAVTPHPRGSGS